MKLTSFLPLDHVDTAGGLPEDLLGIELVDELVELHPEDPRDDVGPVTGGLPRQERQLDLGPLGGARHRDEQGRSAEHTHQSDRILKYKVVGLTSAYHEQTTIVGVVQ